MSYSKLRTRLQSDYHLKERAWIGLVILIFGVVYLRSLTFIFIEGDDARSIAYHVLGRDPAILPPYANYHSMMDFLLALLPVNEPLLRISAISLSAVAAVIASIMMLEIAWGWSERHAVHRYIATPIVLLAIPELFYLGLVYQPIIIAMMFNFSAHVVARRALWGVSGKPESIAQIVFSLLLFGIGSAIRWDATVYGAVIVADLMLLGSDDSKQDTKRQIAAGILWGLLALLAWIVMVVISGYTVKDIMTTLVFSGTVLGGYPLIVMLANLQTLLTPATLLFSVVGFASLIRESWRLAIVILTGIVLSSPWLPSGAVKMLMAGFPGIVVCIAVGFSKLWDLSLTGRYQTVVHGGLLILTLLPWIAGIQVTYGDSAYGPKFEIRAPDRPVEDSMLHLSVGEGALVPTSEGPRSMWGQGAVLVGGAWRTMLQEEKTRRLAAIQYALDEDLPLLLMEGSGGMMYGVLLEQGFNTTDPYHGWIELGILVEVKHFKGKAGEIMVLRSSNSGILARSNYVESILEFSGSCEVVWQTYPSVVRDLYLEQPDAVQIMDDVWLVSLTALDATPADYGLSC